MNYYALLARTPWAGPTAHYQGGRLALHRGSFVDPPAGLLEYELRVDKNKEGFAPFPPLDLHNAGRGHLLVSERLKQCLDKAGIDNIQYLRGMATYAPTKERLSYHVANVVGAVEALDRDAAECIVDEEGIVESFNYLRIDRSKAQPFDLFRLYESFLLVIVSERIKIALERAGVSGIRFMGEADWEPGTL